MKEETKKTEWQSPIEGLIVLLAGTALAAVVFSVICVGRFIVGFLQ